MEQITKHEHTPRGRGFGRFVEGALVIRPDQVQVGDLLTEHDTQFNARNLVRVTSVSPAENNFHGRIVDPNEPNRRGIGTFDDICFWVWECDPKSPDTFKRALHRAVLPMPSVVRHPIA